MLHTVKTYGIVGVQLHQEEPSGQLYILIISSRGTNPQNPLNRALGEPQDLSECWREEKISFPCYKLNPLPPVAQPRAFSQLCELMSQNLYIYIHKLSHGVRQFILTIHMFTISKFP
jgi:hypothetical protein